MSNELAGVAAVCLATLTVRAETWRRMGILDGIRYGMRDGKHDLTPADWRRYLDFADLHWH